MPDVARQAPSNEEGLSVMTRSLAAIRADVEEYRRRLLDHYRWSRDPNRAPCPVKVAQLIRHRWWKLYRHALAELRAAHGMKEAA